MRTLPLCLSVFTCFAFFGSSGIGRHDVHAFSSDQAILVELSFDGRLTVTQPVWNVMQTIEDQLLFTIGHLNGDRAVGRLDAIRLSRVRTTEVGGETRITYHAELPVAWGDRTSQPTSYTLRLPRRLDYADMDAFANRYKDLCTDFGAHDVDAGNMFYYYRPRRPLCAMKAADVVDLKASVRVAKGNTTGKYPEYDEVWKDKALDVVAIFGKFEEGATTASDAGIAGYNAFVDGLKRELGSATTTVPSPVPKNPGVSTPDVTFIKTQDGSRTTITALLVDNLDDTALAARYGPLSGRADVIIYNGHGGFGTIAQTLADEGSFVPRKYMILFVNTSDSFTYLGAALAQKRLILNPGDVDGGKYMDVVANAMPAFFSSMASASLALIRGLMTPDAPKTYEDMLRNVDASQVVVVTGEEDNVFDPGPVAPWTGMDEAGAVSRNEEQHFVTTMLSEGNYTFTLNHDPTHPGGDADLYIGIGQQPTTTSYACRPYKSGSDEECAVQLATPARIFVTVRGYADMSYFLLTGRR